MFRSVLLYTCLFLSTPVSFASSKDCESHQCLAVIDAGSSGTRLHVYAYDRDETNTPIHITELWDKKIKPALSTVPPNKEAVALYLSTLLNETPFEHIPVYFYATAGMRLQPQPQQEAYYQAIQSWFSQNKHYSLVEAKTITGEEEGLYDWLAVNYHLGTLSTEKTRVGVLDIGGASVQIILPLGAQQNDPEQSEMDVDVYGQHIRLSVHSFLGLGQDQTAEKFLQSTACFPKNYPLADDKFGQGDAATCATEISAMMNRTYGVRTTIEPLLAAHPVDAWYAIGGMSYLAESKAFAFPNHQLSPQSLMEQANNSVCQKPWDQLSSQFPKDKFLYEYCLLSSYYYALIVGGYGFYPDQSVHYLPEEENVSWTSGVVLAKNPQQTMLKDAGKSDIKHP